ncbi:MAG: hypothetical protein J6O41_04330 [Clostridia bacterium]|nr:hypothetical protein [Clostridia bacterium]
MDHGITTEAINRISRVFLETLESLTGKETIIYSNLNHSINVFSKELANRYPLWLAYYGNYNSLYNVNSNWDTWEGVQYTSTGIVPGVNGYVDRNRFTRKYFFKGMYELSKCRKSK